MPEQIEVSNAELLERIVLLDKGLGGVERMVEQIDVSISNQSAPRPSHDKLFTALAKAQAEIQDAAHDAEADAGQYKYQYATLSAVLNAVRPVLAKHGLSLIQMPGRVTNGDVELLSLTTIIGHSSGQSIENYFEMYPPKKDPQGIGSAMTYMRRYVVMAMCGIAGAADDDAERTKAEPETITAAEADSILSLADDLFGSDADDLLARMCDKIFGVESIPKIPKGQAEVALQRIQNTRDRKDREATASKEAKPAEEKKPAKKPSA